MLYYPPKIYNLLVFVLVRLSALIGIKHVIFSDYEKVNNQLVFMVGEKIINKIDIYYFKYNSNSTGALVIKDYKSQWTFYTK